MADARIVFDFRGIYRKTSPENQTKGKIAMANQMLIDTDPYIPLEDGELRVSGRVEGLGDALTYNTVYARAQFYGSNGIVSFNNYTTPGTGKRWDEKASENHMDSWEKKYLEGAGLK